MQIPVGNDHIIIYRTMPEHAVVAAESGVAREDMRTSLNDESFLAISQHSLIVACLVKAFIPAMPFRINYLSFQTLG